MQRRNFPSFICLSRVLWHSLLLVMLAGLLDTAASAQSVSFGAKTAFGTGRGPYSFAVGDFNGDGKLDLAVANYGSYSVSILLGTGTGSFGAKTDFDTGGFPDSVAVGDFNGDGKLDLVVTNLTSSTVSILLGTGTGSFGAKTDFDTGGSPRSVAVGDFNNDGKLDLAVPNEGTISILLGKGTGAFGRKSDFAASALPSSVAAGDFNGDGELDLAVANIDSDTVSILLGSGAGSFGAKTDFGTGGSEGGSGSVAVGDFNGDGNLDLTVVNSADFESDTDPATVSILLGTGTGSFGAKTDFGTGSGPTSVAVGDFNSDGRLDLAVSNNGSETVSVLLGTGAGTFGAKTDFASGASPYSAAVGDFNGDGILDLAVTNLSNTVSILLAVGPTSFSLEFDSPTVTVLQGQQIRVTVNINRMDGFTGNVTVTPPDPAWGINPKRPDPVTTTDASLTFKLKIKGGAQLGPHQERFTARDDSGHTQVAILTVIVQ